MFLKRQEFYRSLTAFSPGLVERVKKCVEDSEKRFQGKGSGQTGFLWEHTVLVASLAFRIARGEKEDSNLAALVGLLHDAGKFEEGRYHPREEAEEEAAARLARRVLEEAGLSVVAVGHVVRALRSLYNSGGRRNGLADIVHDADFLTKSGFLGVASFFMKSTLRGRNLERSLVEFLSRELTYAASLPQNMRTETGRKMAAVKSQDTLRFYRSFLAELKRVHRADFKVRSYKTARPGRKGKQASLLLALPSVCGDCGGRWDVRVGTEKGVKCERSEAVVTCSSCRSSYTVSFCLPEIG
jgi:HD superfamily phosphodiesterase